MINTLSRRVIPLVGVAAVMLGFGWQQSVPSPQGDLWFHLRLGEQFLNGWSVRHPGHLGPFDSAEWVPTQWLTQVAMAWGADRAGPEVVVWATVVLLVALVALTYTTCRRVAAPIPATLALTLGVFAASPGFSARPQMLSYLFMMATLAGWLGAVRDGRPRYWLLAIAWVWPMCHGLWPVGLSISIASLAAMSLEHRLPRGAVAQSALVVVASFVVSALTPIGLDAYRSLLVVGMRTEYFAEWGAPDFTSPTGAVLGFMLLVVVVGGFRQRPVPWMNVALVVLATAWSLYSLRTTVIGSLLLTPVLAGALSQFVPTVGPVKRPERWAVLALSAGVCAVIAVHVSIPPSTPVVPRWVDARLDDMPVATRVLNDWDTGSYFLYRHPHLSWAMHGYGDVFTDAEIKRNFDLMHLNPGWRTELRKLQVDVALVDPGSSLGYVLEQVEGWDVLQADDEFALMVPPPPA